MAWRWRVPDGPRFKNLAFTRTAIAILLGMVAPLVATGQMVSPSIDEGPGPFSYFSKPVDQLSVTGGVSGAEITPEGYVYTGYGELMFFVGPEQMPVSARVRTLEEGYLPVVSYTVEHLGIAYRFTMFSARVGGSGGPIVNFVRVVATNAGPTPRAAFLTSALRYQGEQTTDAPTGDNRFRRPIAASGIGQFHQPGERFSAQWVYDCKGSAFLRDGRATYWFPAEPAPKLALTLRSHYNRVHPIKATTLDVQPTTPTSAASYTFTLAPGASRTLDFRMPLIPAPVDGPDGVRMAGADFDREHDATVTFWKAMTARGMNIELPEVKPVETFRASLIYDLMALNTVEGQDVQSVNQFQYHRFYLRDAADFVRMYDATGYSDIAARVLSLFPSRQQADGNFLSQPSQYDGWGEAMYAYGEHYRRTHDVKFAKGVYPAVVKAVEWLINARAADPLHIMPKSDVRDNEYVAAHLTGYNFLALGGLRSAIDLAGATGHKEDARRFEALYVEYRSHFLALLDVAIARNGGAIPPALDAEGWGGTDWGNLLAVTPMHVLEPHDPRVTATLARSQSMYQEGITTYTEPDDGSFLHHYLTIKNTLTELERNDAADQQQAIREFYAELLHTSSTHAGFEYAIRPWGSRDFEGNLSPHGWFAADFRNLLRNMMVREEGETLHLLSAVSPAWIGAGKRICVERAPSYFGTVAFTLEMPSDSTALLHLNAAWQHAPRSVALHLPWFMDVETAIADGRAVHPTEGTILLPPGVKEVALTWRRKDGASSMSYEKTVASYRAEYAARYRHLLDTGEMSPAIDTWRVPEK